MAAMARAHRPRPARWAGVKRSCSRVAAMPLAPTSTGRPAARSGIRSGSRVLTARARVISRAPVCSDATGHRPALRPACARPMNKMPKARPAARPSNRPAPSLPRTEPLAATSTMAGRATRTPATDSRLGRSPRATPATTGTIAAPTADRGPTTLICPRARPRYSTRVPAPPASPLASPQATARRLGPGPPTRISVTQAARAATAEPVTETRSDPRRREARPPPKSELPYRTAAARASKIPIVIPHLAGGYSSTLTGIGPDDKVQSDDRNQDQSRTAGAAAACRAHSAAPPDRDLDPGRDPRGPAGARILPAAHPGAGRRPGHLPRGRGRGLPAADRRGVPEQPRGRVYAGGSRAGAGGRGAAPGDRAQAGHRPQLRPRRRVQLSPGRVAAGHPRCARRRPERGVRLPDRARRTAVAHGAGRLPEPGARHRGRTGSDGDLHRLRAGREAAHRRAGRGGRETT